MRVNFPAWQHQYDYVEKLFPLFSGNTNSTLDVHLGKGEELITENTNEKSI